MDSNQIEKIKVGFGPKKWGDCTLVWDKNLNQYHLLEIDRKSKAFLVDKKPLPNDFNDTYYEYILVNWTIIYQNIK